MKRFFVAIFLFVSWLGAFAQNDLFHFPEKLPNGYKFNAQTEFNDAKKEAGKLLPSNFKDQFAERMTAQKLEYMMSGEVYIGWDEMETYLNGILKRIIPDSCKKNQRIHVYPIRNSEFNAFSIHDGSLFFNISLFSEASNEAAIAFILGHELAHYIHRDVVKSYNKRVEHEVKREKGKEDSHYSYQVELAEYNRDQEQSADSLGAALAANAGYDLNFAIGSFYKFKNLAEQSYEKANSSRITMARKDENKLPADSLDRMEDLILATHPDDLTRIRYFSNYIRKFNKPDAKDFLSDQKALFEKLKSRAKIESLEILLSELDFRECTSRAFTYFLIENNDIYLYYLLESLRRGFEMNHRLPDRPFLTEDLKAGIFKKGEGILHNLHALIRDTNDYKLIKPSPLTNTNDIAFETWDDAFNYFADLSIEKNYAEGYLPIALRNNDTIPLRDFYLDKYIAASGTRYKEYAQAIKSDKLLEALSKNSRSLVLFDDIDFSSGRGMNFKIEYFHSMDVAPNYSAALNNMVTNKFRNKEYVDEYTLRNENFNKYYTYRIILNSFLESDEIFNKTATGSDRFKENAVIDENKFNKLFLLSPELWNIFKKENIRSLHFLRASSYRASNTGFSFKMTNNTYTILSCYGDVKDKNEGIYFDKEQVYTYKMKKPYFLDTVYHNLKLYNEK